MEKKLEAIKATYSEMCEFYLIDKGDEKAQQSQEFFKFFTQFVDSVVKSMPKEEKKRAVGGARAGGATASGTGNAGTGAASANKFGQKIGGPPAATGGMANMMAELKIKQSTAEQK